jgi:hypothetical protein
MHYNNAEEIHTSRRGTAEARLRSTCWSETFVPDSLWILTTWKIREDIVPWFRDKFSYVKIDQEIKDFGKRFKRSLTPHN